VNESHHTGISRRDFLRATGTSVAAAIISSQLSGCNSELPPETFVSDDPWGLLVDITRCFGCESCALACFEANGIALPEIHPQNLSCDSPCIIEHREYDNCSSDSRTIHIKHQCMNCLYPDCVTVCEAGALRKMPDGPVVFDAELCISCGNCQAACPFGLLTYDWNQSTDSIQKCQLCAERLAFGQQPACVSSCPTGALRFGKRKALLAQAHAQITFNPGRYVDHVYGEFEAGGTSVLYLSPEPFSELGFPELGLEPILNHDEAGTANTPIATVSVAALACSLHWIIQRRMAAQAIECQSDGKKQSRDPSFRKPAL